MDITIAITVIATLGLLIAILFVLFLAWAPCCSRKWAEEFGG